MNEVIEAGELEPYAAEPMADVHDCRGIKVLAPAGRLYHSKKIPLATCKGRVGEAL